MQKDDVKTFPDLIRWIAKTRHRGAFLPIASRVGVSSGLIWQWRDGSVKTPELKNLQRLCEVYSLDFPWVMSLVPGHAELIEALSDWTRTRQRRRGRRLAATALALALGVGSGDLLGPPVAHAQAVDIRPTAFPLIGRWLMRLRVWWSTPWPRSCILRTAS